MFELRCYEGWVRAFFSAEEIEAELTANPGKTLGSTVDRQGIHTTLSYVGEAHPRPFKAVLIPGHDELREATASELLESVERSLAERCG